MHNHLTFTISTVPRSPVKLKVDITGVREELCANVYRAQQFVLTMRHLCVGGERGSTFNFIVYL